MILAVLVPGCASQRAESGPPRSSANEPAVRVVNRTSTAVVIEADAQPLGEVPPGGEELFPGITAGTHDLYGYSSDRSMVFRRDLLTLEPGETFTWVLREGDRDGDGVGGDPSGGGGVAARAGGGATIVIDNGTNWTVDVLLDGQRLGTVAPAQTLRFGGIDTGSHTLEARSEEATFPREFPVLEPGETFTWRLRRPPEGGVRPGSSILPEPGTGRLRVENPHSEALRVLANGTPLGSVAAGRARIFDELTAVRVLLGAESEDGRRRFPGPSTRIEAGRVTTWRIGSAEAGGVVFREEAREVFPLPGEVRPGDEDVDVDDRDGGLAGDRAVEDRDGDGVGGDRDEDLDFPPERRFPADDASAAGADEAPSPAPTGRVFIVRNGTTQDLQVFADGAPVGVVGAGMTERFAAPSLRFTPSAVSANGKSEYDHPAVDLTDRATFTWMIEP